MALRHGCFGLLLVLVPFEAGAQPSQTDKAFAQSLFDQGKKLMGSGNFEQACPKLEESQRLDPGGGTLLNLALCHERQGKIATAWSEFKEALGAAKRDGRQDRIDAASEHIAALEPKLPMLTLVVTGALDEPVVKLDGAPIGRAAWGTPVAIDPGSHEIAASATGKKPWVSGFTIALAEKKRIEVPALEIDPNAAATTEPEPASAGAAQTAPADRSERPGGSTTLGWVIGGAGVAAIGVGTFFGFQTLSKKKQSDELCPTDSSCSDRGVELNEEANTSAWISNIGFGLGLVAVGVGTYIIVSRSGSSATTGRETPGRTVALRASVAPGGGRLAVSGSW
jgi:hypothetical protein